MRRLTTILIVAVVLAVLTATIVEAAMIRFYIVPLGTGETGNRGPGYIQFRGHPGMIVGQWCFMDYGAMPSGLLVATENEQAQHELLVANADLVQIPPKPYKKIL